jgi:pyruvate-formate lyase-activating enzyme
MLRRVVCGGVARRAGLSTCANLAKASKSAAPQLTVEEILRALPPEAASEAREAPVVRPHALDDRFGRRHTYLRVSLTERCNLRCQYCMPEEGVALSADSALLTTSEVARLVSLFVRAGVSKVRFTGGEPTVRRDLVDVVRGANELRREGLRSIAMTTNGVVLAPRLPALLDAGLDALNVSLDTLDPRKFELITRRRGHERVLQAIRQAVACGRLGSRVKVNAVVVRGINDGEVADFVEWTRHEAVEVRARRGAARRGSWRCMNPCARARRCASSSTCPLTATAGTRASWFRTWRWSIAFARALATRSGGSRCVCARARARARLCVRAPQRPLSGRAQRHGQDVGRGGLCGARGLHLVDDGPLLLFVQPRAPHGRRQPQGVLVRPQRSQSARRHATGCVLARALVAGGRGRRARGG